MFPQLPFKRFHGMLKSLTGSNLRFALDSISYFEGILVLLAPYMGSVIHPSCKTLLPWITESALKSSTSWYHDWSTYPPPNVPPNRNMDLIAGLTKGNQNQRLISPDHKVGYFWGGSTLERGVGWPVIMIYRKQSTSHDIMHLQPSHTTADPTSSIHWVNFLMFQPIRLWLCWNSKVSSLFLGGVNETKCPEFTFVPFPKLKELGGTNCLHDHHLCWNSFLFSTPPPRLLGKQETIVHFHLSKKRNSRFVLALSDFPFQSRSCNAVFPNPFQIPTRTSWIKYV